MIADRNARRQDAPEPPAHADYGLAPGAVPPSPRIDEVAGGVARTIDPATFRYAMSLAHMRAAKWGAGQTDPRIFACPETPVIGVERQPVDTSALEAPWSSHVPSLARGMRQAISDSTTRLLGPHADESEAHAHRVGALFKLADRLVEDGTLEAPVEGEETQHRLQKCAYIAQQMGSEVDYEFDFLGNGAFSTDLAVDVHYRGDARDGSEPFGGDPGRIGDFVRLVHKRTTEWLQVATFAICPTGMPTSREEFVELVSRRGSAHARRLVGGVFDDVASLGGPGRQGSQGA